MCYEKAEKQKFERKSESQRVLLHAFINKVMFEMLLEQEKVLAALHFPRFSNEFVKHLESASKRNTSGGINSPEISSEISSQQRLLCALLSIRLLATQQQQQRQYRSLHVAAKSNKLQTLSRGSSSSAAMDGLEGDNNYDEHTGHRRRSKRRKSIPNNLDIYGGYVSGAAFN